MGGTSATYDPPRQNLRYCAAVDIRSWFTDENLDFLIEQVCVMQSLTTQIHQVTGRLDNAYKVIDQMQNYIHSMQNFKCWAKGLGHWSMFGKKQYGDLQYVRTRLWNCGGMRDNTEKLPDKKCQNQWNCCCRYIVFQRVRRLGRKCYGTAPDGCDWRPRPVIAGFRDYGARKLVMDNAKELKGTSYSIQQDYSPEIKVARGELWDDLRHAESENKIGTIAYPAKLIIDGMVIRCMFPVWN